MRELSTSQPCRELTRKREADNRLAKRRVERRACVEESGKLDGQPFEWEQEVTGQLQNSWSTRTTQDE